MYRIFMIEDDNGILEAVKNKGEKWELKIFGVKNFRKILSEFSEVQPHLVIMDISLPAFDGYHWCTEIRKISNVPIFFHRHNKFGKQPGRRTVIIQID